MRWQFHVQYREVFLDSGVGALSSSTDFVGQQGYPVSEIRVGLAGRHHGGDHIDKELAPKSNRAHHLFLCDL